MACAKLKVIALGCLSTTALLALAVAHSHAPYGFEDWVLQRLGPPSTTTTWVDLTKFLVTPTICAVLVLSFAFGIVRRAVLRVALYAALAAATLQISERVVKPLVHRTYGGALTFPSGSVTAVSATALAMWLALYPLLGKGARKVTLVLVAAWALLISLAVLGAHWHTPLDDVGSVLLSVGVITAGAALFEQAVTRGSSERARHARVG